jgi:hypothetical protein
VELTHEERKRLANRISMTLANLPGAFTLYWIPEQRRIAARSIDSAKPWRVPPGALKIGVYCGPMRARTVLEDLEDALARGAVAETPPSTIEETSVAAPRCDREAALAVLIPPAIPFNAVSVVPMEARTRLRDAPRGPLAHAAANAATHLRRK